MLRDKREVYRPFKYPQFEEIHRKLYTSFWHPNEVSLDDDIGDFKTRMTEAEIAVVSRVLKNFVQSEIHIGCFWGDFVASWFKHPEIQNVARYVSGSESIHAVGYDLLNTTLGLEGYDTLKDDPNLYARIKLLTGKKAKSSYDILRQIFLYSVMGEGVSLFSSFLIMFAFTKKNLMKGTGQIISWSSLDEAIHSEIGIILFKTLRKEEEIVPENPKYADIDESLYAIADEVVEIEMNLIDRVFENAKIDCIELEVVKNYVRNRANSQLKKAGLKKRFKVNKEMLKESEFFDITVFGESVLDFFSNKESSYSKGALQFNSKVWED